MKNKPNLSLIFLLLFCICLLFFLLGCPPGDGEEEEEGLWVVCGMDGVVRMSSDAINWQWGNSGHVLRNQRIATDNNGFWLMSAYLYTYLTDTWEFGLYRSTDGGFNWTQVSYPPNQYVIDDIAISSLGLCIIVTNKNIFYSNNTGNSWFEVTNHPNVGYTLDAADTDDISQWVICGHDSDIFWSSQPMSQWFQSLVLTSRSDQKEFLAVAYAGRRTVNNEDQKVWITVGGDNGNNKGHIFRSLDHGLTWSQIILPNPPSEGDWFRNIASDDNGNCVVGGSYIKNASNTTGLIWYTADYGDTWHEAISTNQALIVGVLGIAPNKKGRWLVTLGDGSIMYSDDMATWTQIGPIVSGVLPDVAYGKQ